MGSHSACLNGRNSKKGVLSGKTEFLVIIVVIVVEVVEVAEVVEAVEAVEAVEVVRQGIKYNCNKYFNEKFSISRTPKSNLSAFMINITSAKIRLVLVLNSLISHEIFLLQILFSSKI